jgi:hypothetical protein
MLFLCNIVGKLIDFGRGERRRSLIIRSRAMATCHHPLSLVQLATSDPRRKSEAHFYLFDTN